MQLIDDLLQVLPQQRRDEGQHPLVLAIAVEGRIDVGRPLHVTHQAAEFLIRHDAIEQVLVAKAAPVAHAGGVLPIESRPEFSQVAGPEDLADDGVALGAKMPRQPGGEILVAKSKRFTQYRVGQGRLPWFHQAVNLAEILCQILSPARVYPQFGQKCGQVGH
jgi:hypothetical protein